MFMTSHQPVANFYPVEVSGWDASELFFVEKSELKWEEDAGKQVIMHRMLREGAHIFVRLILQSAPIQFPMRLTIPVTQRKVNGNFVCFR